MFKNLAHNSQKNVQPSSFSLKLTTIWYNVIVPLLFYRLEKQTMNQNLIKVTTTFQNTWLINLKKDAFADENDILFGDTLRLSISKNDSYYFSEAIALTYSKDILSIDEPTEGEIEFFYAMKIAQEKMFSKTLAAKYGLEKYLIPTLATDKSTEDK